MDLNFSSENCKFSHGVIDENGNIIIYFKPHKHGSIELENLPANIQEAWKLAVGYSAVEVAENLEEGSTGDFVPEDLENEIQEKVDDRIAKKEAEEIEKEPI